MELSRVRLNVVPETAQPRGHKLAACKLVILPLKKKTDGLKGLTFPFIQYLPLPTISHLWLHLVMFSSQPLKAFKFETSHLQTAN